MDSKEIITNLKGTILNNGTIYEENGTIYKEIEDLTKILNEIGSSVRAESPYQLLEKLKRAPIEGNGRYNECSWFEAANRIMTDLVILYGVKYLLDGKHNDKGADFYFKEYVVELGNKNENLHDIMAVENDKISLIGEAFNVATSLFNSKKRKSLDKLIKSAEELGNNPIKILIYNSDAGKPEPKENEYHITVKIEVDNQEIKAECDIHGSNLTPN